MSDNDVDDDWLYGESDVTEVEPTPVQDNTIQNTEAKTNGLDDTTEDTAPKDNDEYVSLDMLQPPVIEAPAKIIDEQEENSENVPEKETTNVNDDADSLPLDEDEDDNINVVIGDIGPICYGSSLHVKRGNIFTLANQKTGRWTVEDMESVGKINNIPAYDFDIDSSAEKPWLKPGANIADFFNYGFNEQTWKDYCLRQKEIAKGNTLQGGRTINVIGAQRRPEPNDNVIEVMTAGRRDYAGKPDIIVPPPSLTPVPASGTPSAFPATEFPVSDGNFPNFHSASFDSSADDQWINQEWGTGSDMKNVVSLSDSKEKGEKINRNEEEETKSEDALEENDSVKADSIESDRTKDDDKSRDHELERTRERSKPREKSRRDRSRSRSHGRKSKRNRSRSRSSHRSHKKKKSKKARSKEKASD